MAYECCLKQTINIIIHPINEKLAWIVCYTKFVIITHTTRKLILKKVRSAGSVALNMCVAFFAKRVKEVSLQIIKKIKTLKNSFQAVRKKKEKIILEFFAA